MINEELGGWFLVSNEENKLSSLELLIKLADYQLFPLIDVKVEKNPKHKKLKNIKVFYIDS